MSKGSCSPGQQGTRLKRVDDGTLWPFFVSSLEPGTLPLASQESVIVEDLLYVLIGVDGRYITAQALVGRQNRAFALDPNLDLSIKELVTRILPVAASYSAVTRYRAGFAQGRRLSCEKRESAIVQVLTSMLDSNCGAIK